MTEHSWVLESGYGCVAVFGAVPVDPADLAIGGTLVEWLDLGSGESPVLMVKGGSQYGPFDVTVRLLDAAPDDPDESWEDVSEVSVTAADDLSLGDLETGPEHSVAAPPGSYRLRAAARGRTEGAARERTFPDEDGPSFDEPLEHLLLELWPAPASAPAVVRETSRFAHEVVDPPAPQWPAERGPGLEAARRVAADLRGLGAGRRILSGELGVVELSTVVAGTRVRVYNRVKLASGWPPANGGTLSSKDAVGDRCRHYADPPDSDGVAPLLGMIETTVLEIDKPERLVLSWNWRVAGPDGRPYPTNPLLLAEDAVVELTFTQDGASRPPDEVRTRVEVRHGGVPAEWVEDLRALWAWEVARLAAL